MTGDPVNLRLARKRKAREEAELEAARRRARFGRSKAERELEAKRAALAVKALDGHVRDES